jgi:hypothetical protein
LHETKATIQVLNKIQYDFEPQKRWQFFVPGALVNITRYVRNPNPTGKLSDIFELDVNHEEVGNFTGLELLEELADRFPTIASKLAEPM